MFNGMRKKCISLEKGKSHQEREGQHEMKFQWALICGSPFTHSKWGGDLLPHRGAVLGGVGHVKVGILDYPTLLGGRYYKM